MDGSIRINSISKSYNSHQVLRGVSFECGLHERLVILGDSGVGKTTTLKIIAGLEEPDEGSVWVSGVDVTTIPPQNRNMGFVFQDNALWPGKTVHDHLRLPLKWRKETNIEERIDEILELIRLTEKRTALVQELSGGQKQRVALARALIIKPSVVLMDEPFSDLDPPLRLNLRGDILELQRSLSFCLIFVTHDCEEALAIADKLVILRGGEVIQDGMPREVLENPVDSQAARFLGYNNIFPVRKKKSERGDLIDIPDLSLEGIIPPKKKSDSSGSLEMVIPSHALDYTAEPKSPSISVPQQNSYLVEAFIVHYRPLPGGQIEVVFKVMKTGKHIFTVANSSIKESTGSKVFLKVDLNKSILVPAEIKRPSSSIM
jgi:ABC-type sugar transport system ATPase subunit